MIRRLRLAAASSTLLGAVLLTGCGTHRSVVLHVTPSSSAEYQPVEMSVTGLRPHRVVRLSLRSRDVTGVVFSSSASYRADGHGAVDLARTAPIGGLPYAGAWRMGLLVSMAAAGANGHAWYRYSGPRRFTLTASAGGREIARTSFTRMSLPRPLTIRYETVAGQGFQGGYAAPRGARRLPAVLELGGSEGGAKWPDEELASTGVAVLFVGYFAAPGLPRHLVDIPLEYFRRALLWLARRPEVDPQRITVAGTSRGSEAALLLGVHYPSLVHAVAAFVPSGVVHCGYDPTTDSCPGPAWTFRGRGLSYTQRYNDPYPADAPSAVIPVERIKGPLLLSCGGEDQLWTSCRFAQAIVARLRAHHWRHRVALYAYPHAGHYGAQLGRYWIGEMQSDTYVPADERARERLWPHAVAFLKGAGA